MSICSASCGCMSSATATLTCRNRDAERILARQLPIHSADILQALLHQRYKLRRSTLITSNRILDDWQSFLGDAALTTAILDRLLHRSVLVEFRGKSYRLKEAASRLANGAASE